MTYRFLLNLHEASRTAAGSATTQGGHSAAELAGQNGTLVFRANGGRHNVVSRMTENESLGGVYGDEPMANGDV
ncbi:hypothetical protein TRAPUB_9146 [Trametes pubescens]|uniref:Uncharacterized protein n=1 Tax=Trametes pubescens TaxID=154538 RepID=A0A1M2W3A3_TRAPU|nr:hypothetical protein TRAPUB_9146 [Trametes pubescens]